MSDIGLATLAVCKRLQKIDLNAVKGTRTNITYQGCGHILYACVPGCMDNVIGCIFG